jgi:hypothetical protein
LPRRYSSSLKRLGLPDYMQMPKLASIIPISTVVGRAYS